MKFLSIVFLASALIGCPERNNDKGVDNSNLASTDKDSTATLPQNDTGEIYLISIYDNVSRDLGSHREVLKELSDSGVFSVIHEKLLLTISKKHLDYFTSKPEYSLLYSTPGDLFQNGGEDNAFVVYDKSNSRVSILVYDELNNSYFELFREIKVKNGLETAECNYGTFGTLDYQLADELVYQRDHLMEKPESHLEQSACKIVDITKDEDMVLGEGCFAKNFPTEKQSKSFCIPTSSVYNNWECLTYDKSKNIFIIFYGQAFAD